MLVKKSFVFLIILFVFSLGIFLPVQTNAAIVGKTSVSPQSGGLSNGLVGYWTFDGKDIINGRINDVSGSAYHGNTSGIATSTFYRPGIIGQGTNYDGVDDYIVYPDTTVSSFGTGIRKTITFWFRPKDVLSFQRIIGKTGGTANEWRFYINGAKQLEFIAYSITSVSSTEVLANDKLYFAALSYDGTNLSLSINGGTPATAASSDLVDSNSLFYIGQAGDGANFRGLIDDVRIYDHALTTSEIKKLYSMGATKQAVSAPVNASKPGCTGINCGLIGYWTFDGKDVVNGRINDTSGNGNHGNTVGIATSTFYKTGKVGQAVKFNGSTQYMDLPDIAATDSAATITIAAWVNLNSISQNQAIEGKYDGSGGHGLQTGTGSCGPNTAASLVFFINSGASYVCTNSSVINATNRWYHVVATFDNSLGTNKYKIYVDGVSQTIAISGSPDAFTSTGASASNNQIGRLSSGIPRYFDGTIDDVRIYSRALGASEVLQLYNAGAADKQAVSAPVNASKPGCTGINCGLLGYWTFDGKDVVNGRINDVSGGAYHGNTSGIATSTFYKPGKIGQSVNFDGVNDLVTVPNNPASLQLSNGTISAWIKGTSCTGGGGYCGIFAKQNAYGLFAYLDKTLVVYDWGAPARRDTNVRVLDGKYHHVALTFQSGSSNGSTIYIDGVSVLATTMTVNNQSETPEIGRGGPVGGDQYFTGQIDDVRVYNKILTASEVQQIYNSGK